MAQDATPSTIAREAERAGNDAAADVRAEATEDVLDQEVVKRPVSKRGRAASSSNRRSDDPYHRFTLDVWITNFNSVEFGFYKRSRNKAKSRQFTSDMDVFAEIIENGERSGLLAYRQDLWTKQTGFERRLVFKLFGEKLNWRATMDMMLARSVQETVGARGLPVTCFAINTNDHDQVVYVVRSANKWRFMPEHFSFFLLTDGKLRFYRLKQHLWSIGCDYGLYDAAGQRVGLLDGKILSLGGLWRCKVLREHADSRVLAVMKLFGAMLVFNGPARRHVRGLARDVAAGRVDAKLQRQEADLYMNPRRVR
jgi:hypothetical protein